MGGKEGPEWHCDPLRFGVNFSYYGLSLDVSGLGLNVYQTQLLFGAVELPSKLLVYLSVRHAGRRLTQAGTLLGTALTLGFRLLVSTGEPCPGRGPAHSSRPRLLAKNPRPFLEAPAQCALCEDPAFYPEPLCLQRRCTGAPPWRWWGKVFLKLLSLLPTCSPRSCTPLCSGEGSLSPKQPWGEGLLVSPLTNTPTYT